jgi:hypothetical protein
MYAVDITLKNGTELKCLIWKWPPQKKGEFSVLDESNGKIKTVNMKDVRDGRWYDDHTRRNVQPTDFIEKAVSEGWRG